MSYTGLRRGTIIPKVVLAGLLALVSASLSGCGPTLNALNHAFNPNCVHDSYDHTWDCD